MFLLCSDGALQRCLGQRQINALIDANQEREGERASFAGILLPLVANDWKARQARNAVSLPMLPATANCATRPTRLKRQPNSS